jgi:hypothetical protein
VTLDDIYQAVVRIQSEAFIDDPAEEDLREKLACVYLLATGLLETLHAERLRKDRDPHD